MPKQPGTEAAIVPPSISSYCARLIAARTKSSTIVSTAIADLLPTPYRPPALESREFAWAHSHLFYLGIKRRFAVLHCLEAKRVSCRATGQGRRKGGCEQPAGMARQHRVASEEWRKGMQVLRRHFKWFLAAGLLLIAAVPA